jgi:hypothetical protein
MSARLDRGARFGRGLVGAVVAAGLAAAASNASAQTSAPPAAVPSSPSPWTLTVRDLTRVESWRFFEPRPGGGDSDYTFAGNQLFLQATVNKPRFDVTVGIQHVGFVHLPRRAVGPGALGTGALYFTQGSGGEHRQELYVRFANVRIRNVLRGLDVRIGRQGYTSGAEAATSNAAIETIKRQRLDSRLMGEFEWSQYQRTFDGVRADWRRPDTLLTGVVFMPTQGGFARDAGTTMTDVRVAGATGILLPSATRPFELQGFVWRYHDRRRVTGRPDNTGREAQRADVAVTTVGGTFLAARPAGAGRVDALGWIAVQRGDWYGQRHAAFSGAAEAGFQWTGVRWTPWVRAGWLHATGDADAADDRHGTFFPMLPTVRRFSQTTVYSTMNLQDAFVQVQLRPATPLNIRVDVRRLWLASAADRWYAGSGATLSTGTNFGYVTRPSNGSKDFGTAAEFAAACAVTPRWTISGFAATIDGGPVVTGTFAGSRLWFVYFENVVRLDVQ